MTRFLDTLPKIKAFDAAGMPEFAEMKSALTLTENDGKAEILLNGPIFMTAGLFMPDDAITPDAVNDVLQQVKGQDVTLRLNTPGGNVWGGLAIAHLLAAHDADLTIQVIGIAASIGAIIALSGDRLEMMTGTQMMIHRASAPAYGNANMLREQATLLEKLDNEVQAPTLVHAGNLSHAEIMAALDAETFYSAEEAVAVGFADAVLPPQKGGAPADEEAKALADARAALEAITAARKAADPLSGQPAPPSPTPSPAAAGATAHQFALMNRRRRTANQT